MASRADGPPVNESADRALSLILLLRSSESLSVKDAAKNLGIAPSSAHRLLNTLVQRDFARQTSDRKYQPGPEILAGSPEHPSVSRLREIARPSMISLAGLLKETVQLVVLRGANIEFVDGVEGENLLRVGCRFGVQIPAFASAGGKAILAEMSDAQIESLYSEGVPVWETSKIRTTSDLIAELAEARLTGFGANFEESEQGIVGFGKAIAGSHGGILGALTVAMPAAHFDTSLIPSISERLEMTVNRISDHFAQSVV